MSTAAPHQAACGTAAVGMGQAAGLTKTWFLCLSALVLWVGSGCMPGAHQSCSITPLSPGRENMRGSQLKTRAGRYHSAVLLSQAKQTRLGEISLIYYQTNQSRIIRNKTKHLQQPSTYPSLLSRLNFLKSLAPPTHHHRGMGMEVTAVHHMLLLLLLPPQG